MALSLAKHQTVEINWRHGPLAETMRVFEAMTDPLAEPEPELNAFAAAIAEDAKQYPKVARLITEVASLAIRPEVVYNATWRAIIASHIYNGESGWPENFDTKDHWRQTTEKIYRDEEAFFFFSAHMHLV